MSQSLLNRYNLYYKGVVRARSPQELLAFKLTRYFETGPIEEDYGRSIWTLAWREMSFQQKEDILHTFLFALQDNWPVKEPWWKRLLRKFR